MDLTFNEEAEKFRQGVKEFLDLHLPAHWQGLPAMGPADRERFVSHWRDTLRTHGYLAVSWPKEYGGAGFTDLEQFLLFEEFTNRGVPHSPWPTDGIGFRLLGPTLLRWGTEEQRRYFLPRIISGEHRWAQGYSEPDAGSDLASLRTKASRSARGWIINGQKIWQTAGDFANWIFVLARTQPDAPRHKSLTMLLVPLEQDGVEVRPIRTMTGASEFSEVFFTEATTEADNVVGAAGEGWAVAMSLLGHERAAAAALAAQYRIEFARIVRLAKECGVAGDPSVRQRLARCYCKVEVLRHLGQRSLSSSLAGRPPGPESSIMKLYVSEYHQEATELAMDILGRQGLPQTGHPGIAPLGPEPWSTTASPSAWQHTFLTSRAATIYGGASQIQRTAIGERILGLPREPRPSDRNEQ